MHLSMELSNFQLTSSSCCSCCCLVVRGNGGFDAVCSRSVSCRGLRVLDVVDCEMNDDDDEVVDWVAAFPPGTTDLESLSFECYVRPVSFAALEALVARSPRLTRLGVNEHVSLGQLRRLMANTPRLTHLGTGAFRPGDGPEDVGLDIEQMASAFASAGRTNTLVSLSGFREFEPEYLPTIAAVSGNLTNLDFSYCPVTPDQFLPFIGQCHNLERLYVMPGLLHQLGFD
jgi:hypothetical protein